MDYFYLKIGQGNRLALDWLEGRNPLKRPAAVVYYDNLSEAAYGKKGVGRAEAREFIRRGKAICREKTRMVVVHAGEVWVLQPAGEVRFLPSEPNGLGGRNTPKAMPVKVLARRRCSEVPPVLAGIGANQFLARGTFRRLRSDWGNYRAIDAVVGVVGHGDHWDPGQNGPDQVLECLGSTELETLVAKVFEAHGCFVPAYRGGTMKDADLFAQNDTKRAITIGDIRIPPGEGIAIQVKRWPGGAEKTCSGAVNCLIGVGVTGTKAVGAAGLLELVNACPTPSAGLSVTAWLRRSLKWLPDEFLAGIG